MAGFDPYKPGSYFLPRAQMDSPPSLLRTLWPWVEEWQAWFQCNIRYEDPTLHPLVASSEYVKLKPLEPRQEDRTDCAGQGFLRLLAHLKVVLLQDSVILRQEFPHHPIFRHELFVREDYKRFALDVERSLAKVIEPAENRLAAIVPDLAEQLMMMRRELKQCISMGLNRTYDSIQAIERRQEDFYAGKFAITIHASNTASTSPSAYRTIKLAPVSSSEQSGQTQDIPVAAALTPAAVLYANAEAAAPAPASSLSYEVDFNLGASQPLDPSNPPYYQMNRTVGRIPDL